LVKAASKRASMRPPRLRGCQTNVTPQGTSESHVDGKLAVCLAAVSESSQRADAPAPLLQLAVLAASAVVEALLHVASIRFGLARDALAHAGHGSAARFRDGLAALLAGREALSL